jgi:hypothetical protein
MMVRALLVWCGILALAFANGALREIAIVPRAGEVAGRAISSVTLSAAVLLVAWLTTPWIKPLSASDAWTIGCLWLGLTLAFEFLAGHFIFGDPWSQLLADYNVMRGRVWVLVPVTTLVAPLIIHR